MSSTSISRGLDVNSWMNPQIFPVCLLKAKTIILQTLLYKQLTNNIPDQLLILQKQNYCMYLAIVVHYQLHR